MLNNILQYLIESTLYLLAFLLIYRFLLSKLTHFIWIRAFLLGGLVLGLILPLITLPLTWHHLLPGAGSIDKPLHFPMLDEKSSQSLQKPGISDSENILKNHSFMWGFGIMIIYISIVIYRFIRLNKKLLSIRSSIKKNSKEKKGNYWYIQSESDSPAYSFFNYIFMGRQLSGLSADQVERIESHEIIHAKQYHTVDILIIELVSALFWFNPLINLFKAYLQEVHEYTADEKILKNGEMKQTYSHLLIRLTTDAHVPMLSSGFSARQINRRIRMIGKSRSLPWHKFLFFLLVPVAVCLLMTFSYFDNRSGNTPLTGMDQTDSSPAVSQLKVGHITWVDNTVYTDVQLNRKLGIASGDPYSPDHMNDRLWRDEDAVCSLYLDNGYLFFNVESEESPGDEETMDMTMTIYEGIQVKVRNIIIKGNGSVPEEEIMEKILNRPGELFSRIKIIRSVRAIALMDQFDQDHIEVYPISIKDPDTGESAGVDIEFTLTEN